MDLPLRKLGACIGGPIPSEQVPSRISLYVSLKVGAAFSLFDLLAISNYVSKSNDSFFRFIGTFFSSSLSLSSSLSSSIHIS